MDKKEIREAIASCDRVLYKASIALNELRSARNWGIADLLGGGFIMSMIKHGKMDQAEKVMSEVQFELTVLQRELRDVSENLELSLKNSELNRFFDIFFDNVFSDLNTQSKINDSVNDLMELQNDVTLLKSQLEQMLNQS